MTTPYKPRRDYRFEYVYEAMTFIEDRQCVTCVFNVGGDYPMCFEVSEWFLRADEDFEPIPDVDDRGDEGVVCTRYRETEING